MYKKRTFSLKNPEIDRKERYVYIRIYILAKAGRKLEVP